MTLISERGLTSSTLLVCTILKLIWLYAISAIGGAAADASPLPEHPGVQGNSTAYCAKQHRYRSKGNCPPASMVLKWIHRHHHWL